MYKFGLRAVHVPCRWVSAMSLVLAGGVWSFSCFAQQVPAGTELPSVEASLKPSINLSPARRYFVRMGYTYIKPTRTSDATTDLTGPVVGRGDWVRLAQSGQLKGKNAQGVLRTCGVLYSNPSSTTDPLMLDPSGSGRQAQIGTRQNNGTVTSVSPCSGQYNAINAQLEQGLLKDGVNGLGIPEDVKADPHAAGGPTVSFGYFLDDEYRWAVESFLIALPFKFTFYGAGNPVVVGQPLASTKALPPLVILNRYFGDKDAKFRASVGLAGTYAVFFDTKASDFLEEFAGGRTDIKLKNSFGFGPMFGAQYKLTDRWAIAGMVGYLWLKTKGTVTTYDTQFSLESITLGAYQSQGVQDAISAIRTIEYEQNTHNVNNLLAYQAAANGGSLGTFVREIKAKVNPMIFSVGLTYDF